MSEKEFELPSNYCLFDDDGLKDIILLGTRKVSREEWYEYRINVDGYKESRILIKEPWGDLEIIVNDHYISGYHKIEFYKKGAAREALKCETNKVLAKYYSNSSPAIIYEKDDIEPALIKQIKEFEKCVILKAIDHQLQHSERSIKSSIKDYKKNMRLRKEFSARVKNYWSSKQ